MNTMSPKRKSEAADALAAGIKARHEAATLKARAAGAHLETLSLQSELPEGSGVVVKAGELSAARKICDQARAEAERLGGALAEALRRVEETREADLRDAAAARWAQARRYAREAQERLAAATKAFEEAGLAAKKYLASRNALIDFCPDFETRFANQKRKPLEMEGYDRLLRLEALSVSTFHPRLAAGPHTSHATEIPLLLERERKLLLTLSAVEATPQAAL